MGEVLEKVICPVCDGKGYTIARRHPDREKIKVVCPECDGSGWIHVKIWQEEGGGSGE